MTPDELRALADALEPMAKAPRFEDFDVPAFCAWVRAQADAQPVAWIAHNLTTGHVKWTTDRCRAHGWIQGGNLRVKSLYAHPAPAVSQAEPFVPHARCKTPDKCRRYGVCFDAWACSSGPAPQAEPADRCRSSETSDPKATGPMSPERLASNREDAAATVAAGSGEQSEPIDPHMIVAEDRFPDVPAEQWVTCSQCDGDFDRECPICDGLGKVLATDGEQAEPKRELTADESDVLDSALRSSVKLVARGVAEPKRKPLGDWRIAEEATNRQMTAACEDAFYDGVRWAESAHGIGGSDAE